MKADKFAEVLDTSGFTKDAFDVAIAGDDHAKSENTTHEAFSSFVGSGDHSLDSIAPEDIRYAMMLLASGATLEDLRWKISPKLFAILQANSDQLKPANAISTLTGYFDIDESEWTEEQFGPAVYGASLGEFSENAKNAESVIEIRPPEL